MILISANTSAIQIILVSLGKGKISYSSPDEDIARKQSTA